MDAGVERLFYFITANQFISLKLLINVVGRIFPFFSGDCSKSVIYQWFLSFYLSISYANWLNDSKCDKNHKKPASSLVGYSDHEIPSSISMVTRDRKRNPSKIIMHFELFRVFCCCSLYLFPFHLKLSIIKGILMNFWIDWIVFLWRSVPREWLRRFFMGKFFWLPVNGF